MASCRVFRAFRKSGLQFKKHRAFREKQVGAKNNDAQEVSRKSGAQEHEATVAQVGNMHGLALQGQDLSVRFDRGHGLYLLVPGAIGKA